jgi:hypothetical protein
MASSIVSLAPRKANASRYRLFSLKPAPLSRVRAKHGKTRIGANAGRLDSRFFKAARQKARSIETSYKLRYNGGQLLFPFLLAGNAGGIWTFPRMS